MILKIIYLGIGLIFCICFVWFIVHIFTYNPNNKKIADKLIPYIGKDIEFKIYDDNPFYYPSTHTITILDIKPNQNNIYFIKYKVDGKIYTENIEDFLTMYQCYLNIKL